MAVTVNAKKRGKGYTHGDDTRTRINRLRTLLPKGHASGHCVLAAEAELGLVNYYDLEGRGPNDPEAIQALKDQCGGAHWRFPGKTEGKEAELIIRCTAPWHDGIEMPRPREVIPDPEPRSRKRSAGQATDTHCRNGHEWTEESTYVDPRGSKVCRTCKREATERHKARKEGLA